MDKGNRSVVDPHSCRHLPVFSRDGRECQRNRTRSPRERWSITKSTSRGSLVILSSVLHSCQLSIERTTDGTTAIHHRRSRTNHSEISWNREEHAGASLDSIRPVDDWSIVLSRHKTNNNENNWRDTKNNWNWLVQFNPVNSRRRLSKRRATERSSKLNWTRLTSIIWHDMSNCWPCSYRNNFSNVVLTMNVFMFSCWSIDWSPNVICCPARSRRRMNDWIKSLPMMWSSLIEQSNGVSPVNSLNRSRSFEWTFANTSSRCTRRDPWSTWFDFS